ncbi:hypothetical protein MNBD_GAMMA25-602 [hydrothermal vent metagenome]|uniref:Outer membrane protein beta-barrel domain-containing protein n=1 Tax=hydrothermal vent metagenome TaxID=652676 RepID=A0A3B1B1M0_9ZZZZ
MRLRLFSFLVIVIMSSSAIADSMTAQLSNDSARFRYNMSGLGQSFGNLESSIGFLYTDNSDSKNSYLLDVGAFVRGESVEAPIIVSIGGRLYGGKAQDYTVYAVGLGGDVLMLPEAWGGFGMSAFFMIAPGVVSFGDADGLLDYGASLIFEVSPQATVLLGYQKVEADIKATGVGTISIDNGAFFGVHVKF